MSILSDARKHRAIIEQAVKSLDDTTALDAVWLYPKWTAGVTYEADTRIRYGDTLYTILTAHTSQSDWTPDTAPSLFAKVLVSDDGTILAWEQPESTNPYMLGNKVIHNGKTWESTCDNNVWEPGVYGWDEIIP